LLHGACTLGAGGLVGLALAQLLTAPLLDRLARRGEYVLRQRARALSWDVSGPLAHGAALLAITIVAFGVGLIPVAGPVLAALVGAVGLGATQVDLVLVRLSFDGRGRRGWWRAWWAESTGFGLAVLVALVVPPLVLLLPAAIPVGATLLVLEIEDGVGVAVGAREPADATEDVHD
jgi:uncharacterized protein involved in cysteine biosynthesis